eukprot:gene15848-456_t
MMRDRKRNPSGFGKLLAQVMPLVRHVERDAERGGWAAEAHGELAERLKEVHAALRAIPPLLAGEGREEFDKEYKKNSGASFDAAYVSDFGPPSLEVVLRFLGSGWYYRFNQCGYHAKAHPHAAADPAVLATLRDLTTVGAPQGVANGKMMGNKYLGEHLAEAMASIRDAEAAVRAGNAKEGGKREGQGGGTGCDGAGGEGESGAGTVAERLKEARAAFCAVQPHLTGEGRKAFDAKYKIHFS